MFCGEDRRFVLFCVCGINNVFKNFVTKEKLGCEFDWFIHTPIYDFYVTCIWMVFKLMYVLGSEVKLEVHRLMSIMTHCSCKNVGSCLCKSHVISSYE